MSYYSTAILADTPQAYWRNDITSGSTVPDATGNGNTATLTSGVTLNQPGAINGDTDTSIQFGAHDTLSLPYTLNPSAWSALSLEFWIKQTGLWEHVVITVNTTATTYLDGKVYSSGSGDPVLINQSIYWAGSYQSGYMDEIALYNYVLTPAQVQKHFLVGQLILNSGAALYANGTGTAQFDSFRVTMYPDPTQYLTNAGRAVNSVVDHNSNIPPNTRIDVHTSIDGGATYQPVANPLDMIPGIGAMAYYNTARTNKPKMFYRLNEKSGTVAYDSSNNGYDGTIVGGVTLGQPGALAGLNESGDTAMSFDGNTGYILAPSALSINGATAFSVECWVLPAAT